MKEIKKIENDLVNYYSQKGEGNYFNAVSVGWKDKNAQRIRFEQICRALSDKDNFSINDLGCGLGHFFEYLNENNFANFTYAGYDHLQEMVNGANILYSMYDNVSFFKINSSEELNLADFTIASGIFNLKFQMSDIEWIEYIKSTLKLMSKKSTKGVVFNILSSYSDIEYQKQELFYADPCYFFDFCKREISSNVSLFHDYNQFDFTIAIIK